MHRIHLMRQRGLFRQLPDRIGQLLPARSLKSCRYEEYRFAAAIMMLQIQQIIDNLCFTNDSGLNVRKFHRGWHDLGEGAVSRKL